jgi:hypothetical protein
MKKLTNTKLSDQLVDAMLDYEKACRDIVSWAKTAISFPIPQQQLKTMRDMRKKVEAAYAKFERAYCSAKKLKIPMHSSYGDYFPHLTGNHRSRRARQNH